jgi:hypothetical protein
VTHHERANVLIEKIDEEPDPTVRIEMVLKAVFRVLSGLLDVLDRRR